MTPKAQADRTSAAPVAPLLIQKAGGRASEAEETRGGEGCGNGAREQRAEADAVGEVAAEWLRLPLPQSSERADQQQGNYIEDDL